MRRWDWIVQHFRLYLYISIRLEIWFIQLQRSQSYGSWDLLNVTSPSTLTSCLWTNTFTIQQMLLSAGWGPGTVKGWGIFYPCLVTWNVDCFIKWVQFFITNAFVFIYLSKEPYSGIVGERCPVDTQMGRQGQQCLSLGSRSKACSRLVCSSGDKTQGGHTQQKMNRNHHMSGILLDQQWRTCSCYDKSLYLPEVLEVYVKRLWWTFV